MLPPEAAAAVPYLIQFYLLTFHHTYRIHSSQDNLNGLAYQPASTLRTWASGLGLIYLSLIHSSLSAVCLPDYLPFITVSFTELLRRVGSSRQLVCVPRAHTFKRKVRDMKLLKDTRRWLTVFNFWNARHLLLLHQCYAAWERYDWEVFRERENHGRTESVDSEDGSQPRWSNGGAVVSVV